jgi:iron complex transport system substrate-binding protein
MSHRKRQRPGFAVATVCCLILLATVLIAALAGCGSAKDTAGTAGTTSTLAAITSSTAGVSTGDTVSITDDAGRKVTIPKTIKKVYGMSPEATNYVYMLAPDMLAGWCYAPAAEEMKFIPAKYQSLPNLGGWYGKNNTGNIEAIIKASPDLILDIGTTNSTSASQDDRIQAQLHIPVVNINDSLATSGRTFRYLGELLGAQSRAEQLANYCDQVIDEAKSVAVKVKESDKVTVYYAEGNEGLNTDPSGSQHTEVLDLLGAVNVAQVKNASGFGEAAVSLEQVLAWDPQVILVASDPSLETHVWSSITGNSDWATISAVKNKKVYQIPHGPFDWFDRPPCPSRILGVRWVGSLLYPIRHEGRDGEVLQAVLSNGSH